MTKILLDTNAYSGFMAGDPKIFDYIVAKDEKNAGIIMREHLERISSIVKTLAKNKKGGSISAKEITNMLP